MFKESYNANLANGLGNLLSRIMKMAESNLSEPVSITEIFSSEEYIKYIESYDIQKATDLIWKKIAEMDSKIQSTQPFKLVKTDKEKGCEIIKELVKDLSAVSDLLLPILPETSEKIKALIISNKSPEKPLFLRKE
jgi:methionyl-tRNA synthetase